jgi:hypothetical protein
VRVGSESFKWLQYQQFSDNDNKNTVIIRYKN